MELHVSYRKNPFYRFSCSCAATASVYVSYYLLFSSRFRAHGSFSCYSRIIYTDNSHGLSIFSYVCVCISLYAYVRAARAYAVTSAKLVPPFLSVSVRSSGVVVLVSAAAIDICGCRSRGRQDTVVNVLFGLG